VALSALGKFAAALWPSLANFRIALTMRIAAERRADGVYVAAGVELVEPENRRAARLGEALGWQMIKRLRDATGCRVRRRPMLKACGCSTVFLGDRAALTCPNCARKAAIAQIRRLRARRRLLLAESCRECVPPHPAAASARITSL
jgi:hypothetical protein